jgi:hypothetical protein
MNLGNIASVLQIGFSGFAFLLAGLSYRLLKDETGRPGTGRKTILHAISMYTKYTLVMAVLVIVSRVGERSLDHYFQLKSNVAKQEQAVASMEAMNCRGALSRLINAETKVNADYPSLLLAIQESSSNCNNILRQLEEYAQ